MLAMGQPQKYASLAIIHTDLKPENVLLAADGTRAAAEYVVHGEYHHTDEGLPPANGQTYALPGGAFFDIRDDRIARVTNYYNLQDWIRQVRRDNP